MPLFRKSREQLMAEMQLGVIKVKEGAFARIYTSQKGKHDQKKAGNIAGAVVNFVFSLEPLRPDGSVSKELQKFRKDNASLIEDEVSALSKDSQLCDILTDAVRVGFILSPDDIVEISANVPKLEELGVYKSERPTPGVDFRKRAVKFQEYSVKNFDWQWDTD